jgi:cellulose synthase/poly-beta-1,6-N-acetylglucosamine synthase-like glycosyltransferase
VAILFSAHNEAAVILKRLENLAQLDYPADRLQVFAGIDGGSDNTAEIALAWAQSHPNVHVVVSETNHGKTAMLKRLVRTVEEGILPRRHPASPGNTVLRRAGGDTEREKERECCGNFVHGNTVAKIPATLSGGIWKERGEVQQATPLLVFTDANTFFAPDALMNLVAPFEDPEVGGVCGKLVFEKQKSEVRSQKSECGGMPGEKEIIERHDSDPPPRRVAGISDSVPRILNTRNIEFSSLSQSSSTSVVKSSPLGGTDEPVYWNLETSLKSSESSWDSCLGANGAIYAMRPELFWAEIPDNTIIDDFVLGMKVREQGFRMVFEPTAVATEDLPATVPDEWRHRVRIGAGAFQALTLCRACLSPRYGRFALFFWSHKVLRWFTPHLAVVAGMLLSCQVAELLGGNPKVSQFSALNNQQLNNPTTLSILVGILLLVLLTPPGRKALKLLAYFVTMQAALFVGFLKYCKGGLKGTWERTERRGI